MEKIKIENLSFTYPGKADKTLDNIDIVINSGEFVTVCGKSGCGKTTLLKMMKPVLSPAGKISGTVYYRGTPLSSCDKRTQAEKIGYVMQSCDNQIVTDKVWHELAFGAESLGMSSAEIRARVSEMASFFGIQTWFHKNVRELSGGQKQILNLASVMVTSPDVLILDEPTSQLDPIAAQDFLKMLEKINRELGTTVILAEHRTDDTFPISDRVIVMDGGKIISDSTPRNIGRILKNHDMYCAMPVPMRVAEAINCGDECPLTVREGRNMLEKLAENRNISIDFETKSPQGETVVELKDLWFRYEKNSPDVIKNLNLCVKRGEFLAVVGGNGTGKTTMLSLISGINTPYRGKILINGKNIPAANRCADMKIAALPQNPQSIFTENTVYANLKEILSYTHTSEEETAKKIRKISSLCRIENLLESHPYDLSGGEQQRAAFAKILLTSPKILLLDEPTKGLDAHFKQEFAAILKSLLSSGVTVIMVSHDIEFCAEYADRCAMFFDGGITSSGHPREFFSGKNFYTTSANRMARTIIPKAVLADDIISVFGGKDGTVTNAKQPHSLSVSDEPEKAVHNAQCNADKPLDASEKNITDAKKTNYAIPPEQSASIQNTRHKGLKIFSGIAFALLFLFALYASKTDFFGSLNTEFTQILSIVLLFASLLCLFPQKKHSAEKSAKQKPNKRTILSFLFILFSVPLTICAGVYLLDDRNYYFISLLVIFETMLPFFISFERGKHQAKELVIISVLCAIAVAGRTAFFMLPQFKPVTALVIISGVCFGGETGFLVGAITGFVSNFFFGQGPWTPWQMFAFGAVGFTAGILFKAGILKRNRLSLCIFGFLATMIIYGGIMNPASVITWQKYFTKDMILSAYVMGVPFDFIHALSSAFFLWFISEPMIEKLERIKSKYGIS